LGLISVCLKSHRQAYIRAALPHGLFMRLFAPEAAPLCTLWWEKMCRGGAQNLG
jgi:hypothetical protein